MIVTGQELYGYIHYGLKILVLWYRATVTYGEKPKEQTMKITKISAHLSDNNLVVAALLAAFSPFGSLTEGVDGQALAEAILDFVTTKHQDQPGKASKLVSLVWEATTDQISTIEFGSWEVSLRTPTSGTRIRLHRYAGGYHVEADFGSNGSESRSMTILAMAEQNGVKFDAYDGKDRIERGNVLNAVLDRAKKISTRLRN